jgi:hypothetical protein
MRAEPIWVQEVRAHSLSIELRSRRLPRSTERVEIEDLLLRADEVARVKDRRFSPNRLRNWWTGSRIEGTWKILHQADLLLVRAAPPELLEDLLEYALALATSLPPTDPARIRLARLAYEQKKPIGKSKALKQKEPNGAN